MSNWCRRKKKQDLKAKQNTETQTTDRETKPRKYYSYPRNSVWCAVDLHIFFRFLPLFIFFGSPKITAGRKISCRGLTPSSLDINNLKAGIIAWNTSHSFPSLRASICNSCLADILGLLSCNISHWTKMHIRKIFFLAFQPSPQISSSLPENPIPLFSIFFSHFDHLAIFAFPPLFLHSVTLPLCRQKVQNPLHTGMFSLKKIDRKEFFRIF